ncbi:MAG TPA: hypothetical protein PKJ98_19750, partial [Verrucomicrobiota bacterium]|nr:hypothetical protein [Verrucomicrobiota bacterium]
DGSSTVNAYAYGRLVSTTRKDSGGSQVTQTSYAYDAHGRVSATTDARNGATSFVYNNADQVAVTTAPNLGTGEAPQATVTFFDALGRATGQLLPDGTTTTNLYTPAGLLQKTYGSRTYPVEYTYDAQGRMKTMKTWQDFGGNSLTATTRWNYDPYRGVLSYKEYPNATTGVPPDYQTTNGPSYTYTGGGRLKTRKWVRSSGLTTTYSTNTAGDVYTVTYSDGTPTVSYAYDRRGRQSTITHGSGGSQITNQPHVQSGWPAAHGELCGRDTGGTEHAVPARPVPAADERGGQERGQCAGHGRIRVRCRGTTGQRDERDAAVRVRLPSQLDAGEHVGLSGGRQREAHDRPAIRQTEPIALDLVGAVGLRNHRLRVPVQRGEPAHGPD